MKPNSNIPLKKTIIRIISCIIPIISIVCPEFSSLKHRPTHCMTTYNDSMRCITALHQEQSSASCHVGPIHSLSFGIIRINSLLFTIILIISKIRNSIWVRIHCRKLAKKHIHHRGSVSIQTNSIRDSTIKHQSVSSHDVRCRNRSRGCLPANPHEVQV